MRAVITGYTGLTGRSLVEELVEDKHFEKITLIGRSDPQDQLPSKFELIKRQLGALAFDPPGKYDAGFCLLGTTIKKAGSQEIFRKVDLDLVVDFAQHAKASGVKVFHVMSSVGANPKSSNFYLKTKGQMEEAVRNVGFDSLYIYRPSMLLGPRKEFRPAELFGKYMMEVFSFTLAGSFRRYKPIQTSFIAKKMIANSIEPEPGIHLQEFDEIVKL